MKKMRTLVYFLMQKRHANQRVVYLEDFDRVPWEEPGFVCWTRQPVVKGDPVGDLDTPMREFMEREGCPQSFNREDRIYHWREVLDSNSIYTLLCGIYGRVGL